MMMVMMMMIIIIVVIINVINNQLSIFSIHPAEFTSAQTRIHDNRLFVSDLHFKKITLFYKMLEIVRKHLAIKSGFFFCCCF